MRTGRTCPDLDAALFFDPAQIRGAHLLTKKKMPATSPIVNEIVRLIAQVGGFLGRKSDAEPDVKTFVRIESPFRRVTTVSFILHDICEPEIKKTGNNH